MFGILSSKSLRDDAGAMIGSFAQTCPPPAKLGNKPVPEKKVGESLANLYELVAAYTQEHRLGVIGRARLAKALQEEMRQHEYPDELIGRMMNAITVNALVVPIRR